MPASSSSIHGKVAQILKRVLSDHPELLDLRVAAAGCVSLSAVASSPWSPFQLERRPSGAEVLQPAYCLSKIAVPFFGADLLASGLGFDDPFGSRLRGLPVWLQQATLRQALTHSLPPGPTHHEVRLASPQGQTEMLNRCEGGPPGYSEVRSSLLVEAAWRATASDGGAHHVLDEAAFFPDTASKHFDDANLIPNAAVDGSGCYPLFEEISLYELVRCRPSTSSFLSPVLLSRFGSVLSQWLEACAPVFGAAAHRTTDATLGQAASYRRFGSHGEVAGLTGVMVASRSQLGCPA